MEATTHSIAVRRLHSQRLVHSPFTDPVSVVAWMGAVQAQDYPAAKWALSLRAPGLTDADLDRAYDAGEILRTHFLRPTWHFAARADLRWLLALSGPLVDRRSTRRYRELGLDEATFARSAAVLRDVLSGGHHLTRSEIGEVFAQAGIDPAGQRLPYLLMRAELHALICSGARRSKQLTFALLDERAPQADPIPRDQALAEITRRYFTSRGPATLKDFVWWSGLPTADARRGLELLGKEAVREDVDGQAYWRTESTPPAADIPLTVHLLPNYDEYTVGYVDRSAIIDPQYVGKLDAPDASVLYNVIAVNGCIVGSWRRALRKKDALVEVKLLAPLTAAERDALDAALARYGDFLGMAAVLL